MIITTKMYYFCTCTYTCLPLQYLSKILFGKEKNRRLWEEKSTAIMFGTKKLVSVLYLKIRRWSKQRPGTYEYKTKTAID
jgi:hypothetical protein